MKLIIFLGSFLLCTLCIAQPDSTYNEKVLLTFSPSAFLNTFPGVQFGFEKYIAKNKTLEFEVARLFKISQESGFERNGSTRPETKSGIRVKLGFKKLISSRGIFLATLYYRNTKHYFEEWVFIDQGRFEQLIDYNSTKRLIGPTIGFGLTNVLKNRFHLETAINFGIGSYKVKLSEIPENVFLSEQTFELYHRSGDYIYPILGLSLKLKFRL